jgi:molecular chaperone HtpG
MTTNQKIEMTEETKMNFSADVSRLLEIVAHALYSNRDVFLRELISNAADACDRLRYEAISAPALVGSDSDFRIHVAKDTTTRTVSIRDNGIGMSAQELTDNLGTIAKSGTKALMDQMAQKNIDSKEKLSLIGQFGVGFYACFMVGHKVQVISRHTSSQEVNTWESDGRTGFTIRPSTNEEAAHLLSGRGTAIIIHINDDASEFLLDMKLEQVIETYSDHIGFPIYLADSETPVNKVKALWMMSKSEVTEQQYLDFYHHVSSGLDEPICTSHWRAEGTIEYNALLFTPTLRPMDLYDPTRQHAVRLYVKRVYITDNCEGLIYPWLRFLRGVIDSEDLPLNISREMLQHNPVITKIRNGVAKRVLADLNKLSQDDDAAFISFWGQFGAVLKEGLYDAAEHQKDILKIVRFASTNDENALTSLSDYLARMKDGQNDIYYLSGENLETLRNSPQLEGFKARGLEVLFFTDTIDDFWLQSISDYEGKSFKSVTKGDINLSQFAKENAAQENEEVEDQSPAANENIEKLRYLIADALIAEIGEVRLSSRLTDSAVCLIAADNAIDLRMERVLRLHQKYDAPTKRILEINPDHALIKKLAMIAHENAGSKDIDAAAFLLLDQARIIQGEPVPDPSRFAKAMSQFMERGLI